VSEAGDGECDELELRREDLIIHELNLARLGKDLATALGLQAPPCQHDFLQSTTVGAVLSDRGVLPVAFGVYADEQALMNQTQRMRAAIPAGAIVLLLPSGRLLIQGTRERLSALGVHPVPLENFCLMGVGGTLEAKASLQHHLELSLPVALIGGVGNPTKSQVAAPEPCRFVRKGAAWEVAFGGKESMVLHSSGMTYLHVLLSNPGRKLRAFDVVQMAKGRAGQSYQDDGGALADREYLKQVEQEVRKLHEQLEEAIRFENHTRQAELEEDLEEMGAFEGELKSLGGRSRRTNSTTEKVRDNARKAVDRAVKAIKETNPELHLHLRNSLQPGLCSYFPDHEIDWVLKAPGPIQPPSTTRRRPR
jgi:hypothetical protein